VPRGRHHRAPPAQAVILCGGHQDVGVGGAGLFIAAVVIVSPGRVHPVPVLGVEPRAVFPDQVAGRVVIVPPPRRGLGFGRRAGSGVGQPQPGGLLDQPTGRVVRVPDGGVGGVALHHQPVVGIVPAPPQRHRVGDAAVAGRRVVEGRVHRAPERRGLAAQRIHDNPGGSLQGIPLDALKDVVLVLDPDRPLAARRLRRSGLAARRPLLHGLAELGQPAQRVEAIAADHAAAVHLQHLPAAAVEAEPFLARQAAVFGEHRPEFPAGGIQLVAGDPAHGVGVGPPGGAVSRDRERAVGVPVLLGPGGLAVGLPAQPLGHGPAHRIVLELREQNPIPGPVHLRRAPAHGAVPAERLVDPEPFRILRPDQPPRGRMPEPGPPPQRVGLLPPVAEGVVADLGHQEQAVGIHLAAMEAAVGVVKRASAHTGLDVGLLAPLTGAVGVGVGPGVSVPPLGIAQGVAGGADRLLQGPPDCVVAPARPAAAGQVPLLDGIPRRIVVGFHDLPQRVGDGDPPAQRVVGIRRDRSGEVGLGDHPSVGVVVPEAGPAAVRLRRTRHRFVRRPVVRSHRPGDLPRQPAVAVVEEAPQPAGGVTLPGLPSDEVPALPADDPSVDLVLPLQSPLVVEEGVVQRPAVVGRDGLGPGDQVAGAVIVAGLPQDDRAAVDRVGESHLATPDAVMAVQLHLLVQPGQRMADFLHHPRPDLAAGIVAGRFQIVGRRRPAQAVGHAHDHRPVVRVEAPVLLPALGAALVRALAPVVPLAPGHPARRIHHPGGAPVPVVVFEAGGAAAGIHGFHQVAGGVPVEPGLQVQAVVAAPERVGQPAERPEPHGKPLPQPLGRLGRDVLMHGCHPAPLVQEPPMDGAGGGDLQDLPVERLVVEEFPHDRLGAGAGGMLGDPDLVAAVVVLMAHRPPVGQFLGLLQQLARSGPPRQPGDAGRGHRGSPVGRVQRHLPADPLRHAEVVERVFSPVTFRILHGGALAAPQAVVAPQLVGIVVRHRPVHAETEAGHPLAVGVEKLVRQVFDLHAVIRIGTENLQQFVPLPGVRVVAVPVLGHDRLGLPPGARQSNLGQAPAGFVVGVGRRHPDLSVPVHQAGFPQAKAQEHVFLVVDELDPVAGTMLDSPHQAGLHGVVDPGEPVPVQILDEADVGSARQIAALQRREGIPEMVTDPGLGVKIKAAVRIGGQLTMESPLGHQSAVDPTEADPGGVSPVDDVVLGVLPDQSDPAGHLPTRTGNPLRIEGAAGPGALERQIQPLVLKEQILPAVHQETFRQIDTLDEGLAHAQGPGRVIAHPQDTAEGVRDGLTAGHEVQGLDLKLEAVVSRIGEHAGIGHLPRREEAHRLHFCQRVRVVDRADGPLIDLDLGGVHRPVQPGRQHPDGKIRDENYRRNLRPHLDAAGFLEHLPGHGFDGVGQKMGLQSQQLLETDLDRRGLQYLIGALPHDADAIQADPTAEIGWQLLGRQATVPVETARLVGGSGRDQHAAQIRHGGVDLVELKGGLLRRHHDAFRLPGKLGRIHLVIEPDVRRYLVQNDLAVVDIRPFDHRHRQRVHRSVSIRKPLHSHQLGNQIHGHQRHAALPAEAGRRVDQSTVDNRPPRNQPIHRDATGENRLSVPKIRQLHPVHAAGGKQIHARPPHRQIHQSAFGDRFRPQMGEGQGLRLDGQPEHVQRQLPLAGQVQRHHQRSAPRVTLGVHVRGRREDPHMPRHGDTGHLRQQLHPRQAPRRRLQILPAIVFQERQHGAPGVPVVTVGHRDDPLGTAAGVPVARRPVEDIQIHAQTGCRQVNRHRLVKAALGQQALGQRRQAAPGRIPGGIDQPVQRKFEHPGIDDRDIDVITQPAQPCRRQCRLRPGQRGGAHELQGVGMAAQQIPVCRRIEQEAGVECQAARRGDEADAEMIPLVVQRLDLEVQDVERNRLAHPQGAPAGDGVVVDLQFGTLPGILAARIGHDEDQRPQLLNQRGIRRPGLPLIHHLRFERAEGDATNAFGGVRVDQPGLAALCVDEK